MMLNKERNLSMNIIMDAFKSKVLVITGASCKI